MSRANGLYVCAQPGLKLKDRRVLRPAAKVRAAMPWLEPSDQPVLRAWCEMEILCEQAFAALRAFGMLTREGEARRLFHDYRQMRQTQAVYANALGLTPAARIAIKATGTRGARPGFFGTPGALGARRCFWHPARDQLAKPGRWKLAGPEQHAAE